MRRLYTFLCVLFAFGALVCASSAQAGPLYVSLTFDDGLTSQYTERDLLDGLGVDATYYINSGKVGNTGYMSWSQLRDMQAQGHEIGGHTIDHVDLTRRTTPDQTTQVCDDRRALQAQGFDVTTFAYPFGAQNSGVKTVVRDCGYASARITGGLDEPPDCCLYANAIPPRNPDPYVTRAFQIRTSTAIEIYREVVELGRDNGGGWIPFVFHDICTGSCTGWNNYTVRRDLLETFVRWLQADPNIRIRTAANVMAIGNDATAPTTAITSPADSATVAPGTVRIEATASDALGVERVDFLVDGVVAGTDRSSPYSYDWDASAAGPTVRLATRAYDEKGNNATSATHTVTVSTPPDRTAPTVSLGYQPSTVTGTLGLVATASDASGIGRVEFLVDGNVVATDATSPYEATWDSTALIGRSAVLSARAYDVPGNIGTSATRRVSVVTPSSATRPVVSLVTPAGGTTVRGVVDLVADVSSSPTTVSFVEILVDGVSIGIDWSASFHEYWNSAPSIGSTATVVARAVDIFGVPAESAPMVLTVTR